MPKYAPEVATAVIGLAGFELLKAWNNAAPSLAQMRECEPGNVTMKQQLIDADFMVGGLAVILGVSYALISHDVTALVVMLVIFGSVSFWYHSVLNAEAR